MCDSLLPHEFRQRALVQPHCLGRHAQRGPRSQRDEHVQDRQVEPLRRELQHPIPRRDVEVLFSLRRDHVQRAPLRVRSPLRPTRRTRRVDHVRQTVRRQRLGALRIHHRRRGARRDRRPNCLVVQQQEYRPLRTRPCGVRLRNEPLPQRLRRHQQMRTAVREHVRQARRWIRHVQRQIRGAGLHHRHDRDHRFQRSLQAGRDHRLWPRSPRQQLPRQTVRARLQLPIAEALVPEHHRRRIGMPERLLRQEVRQRPRRRRRRRCIEAGQGGTLRRVRQCHRGQWRVVPGRAELVENPTQTGQTT